MFFSREFVLLQQEGSLFQSCLGIGLTLLRKANIGADKGSYYSGFFQLTIGLERLMKTIVIINHMAINRMTVPSFDQVKSYGHDLISLYEKCRDISIANGLSHFNSIDGGSIEMKMLIVLSEFAKKTRYYNLDDLANKPSGGDPLKEWWNIISDIIKHDVPHSKVQRARHNAQTLAQGTRYSIVSFVHSLDHQLLSHDELFQMAYLLEVSAPYVIKRIIGLLHPLKELLKVITRNAQAISCEVNGGVATVPDMSEFIDFISLEDKIILRKKRWP